MRAFVEAHGPRTILRPASGGGSRGVVAGDTAQDILDALRGTDWEHSDFLLSQFVVGVEVSAACIVLDGVLEHLPILQTEHDGVVYDYEAKHDQTRRRHQCPAPLDEDVAQEVRDACAGLYEALGLRGYVRFDFLVSADRVPWFLEVNMLPGMSRTGNLATMAAAAGLTFSQLVRRQLDSAGGIERYRS